jgi:hypothetical protein
MRQYQEQDETEGFTLFDRFVWWFALWLDTNGLIKLERRGVQIRGGWNSGSD